MIKKILAIFSRKIENKQEENKKIEVYNIEDNIPELDVIGEIKLELIIGQKIIDLNYRHELLGWVDYFDTFLTLENGKTISLPLNNTDTALIINFPLKTNKCSPYFNKTIIGNRITNFYSESEEVNISDYSSFIELENKYYIQEKNMSPSGTGQATLYLLSEKDFREKIKGLDIFPNV